MAKVTGVGGVFLKARDPKALMKWYADNLGVPVSEWGHAQFMWNESDQPESEGGSTAFAMFPQDTKHFGASGQTAMLNFRVDDLDALLEQLRQAGVEIDPKRDEAEYGKFAWILDGEGNRVELWQPLKH